MPFRKRRLSSAFLMGAQEHFPARRLILSLLLRITTRRHRTDNPTPTIILLRANQVEPPRVWRRLQSLRRWSHDEEVNEVLSRSPRACRAHGVRGAPRIQLAVGGNPGHCPKIGCTIYLLVGEHRVHISLRFDLLDHRHPHQSPGQNTIHRHQVAQPLGRVSSALQPDFSALKKLSMFQRSAYQSSFSTACCLEGTSKFPSSSESRPAHSVVRFV